MLVGRDGELARLRGLVKEVAAGRGGIVFVEGEPGVGKSAVLVEGLAPASGAGCLVLSGRGDELTTRFPLRPLLDCIDATVARTNPRRAAIDELLQGPASGLGAFDRGNPVPAACEQFLALVDELCAASPVVLVVDDLQWADEATVQVWHRLARSVGEVPLLLVGATRPVPHGGPLDALRRRISEPSGAVIGLEPLPEAAVAALIARETGAPPGPGLLQLAAGAAGNPLYLTELVNALDRDGALRVEGGVADVSADGPPASLTGVISRSLGFLSPATIDVLRLASLLGASFTVSELSAVARREVTELIPAVTEAMVAKVLVEAGSFLMFRHGLIREVVYRDLPETVRSALHREAAHTLSDADAPVDRVAVQLLQARQLGAGSVEPWMLDWLVGAARVLANRAGRIAAELLGPAVDAAAPEDPRKDTLALEYALALMSTGQLGEAEQVARAALARANDPDLIGDLYWVLGDVLWTAGRRDDALRELETALATIPLSTMHLGRLQLLVGNCHYSKGDYDAAERAATDGLAVAATTFDPRAIGYARNLLGKAKTMQGQPGASIAHYDQGLAVTADAPALSGQRLRLGLNRAWAMVDLGHYEQAREGLTEMRRLAEQIGNQPALEHARWIATYLAFDSGQWDDVLAEADAVNDFEYRSVSYGEGTAALVALHRDDLPTARRHLEAGSPAHDLERIQMVDNSFVLARSAALERAGEPADALAALGELPALSSTLWASALAAMTGVRLAMATGDTAAAELYAARLTDNVPNAAGAAPYCRGLITGDPELLEHAADVFRNARRPLLTALALEAAADLRARGGDIAAARRLLADALSLYTDLGAIWDISRANAHFRPYGIRHRQPSHRRPRSGPGSLSPIETTVAELVAQGLSNPQIADRLYLSRRTVQAHVSRILSKLGMQSRVEVAREYSRVQDTTP